MSDIIGIDSKYIVFGKETEEMYFKSEFQR